MDNNLKWTEHVETLKTKSSITFVVKIIKKDIFLMKNKCIQSLIHCGHTRSSLLC